jgi:tetratricopeptide (TPR) repeat protein
MKQGLRIGMVVAAIGITGIMAQQPKKGPMPKSQAELQAIQAVFTALQQNNADGVITAAENLLSKFKDTEFKDTVLFMEAQAYQQKGDRDQMQIYAERALAANPKNYQAALLLADITVQGTREHDLDRDEKLAKGEKYANQAISAISTADKPNPQLSDAAWSDYKKDWTAQAHDALGMAALERKDYDKSISEFKMAIEGAAHPEPAYEVRLASAYQNAGKNDEAIATAQKVMDEPACATPPKPPCTPSQIKSVAQSIRATAILAKNGGKPPAQNNAPPPQVQIQQPNQQQQPKQ